MMGRFQIVSKVYKNFHTIRICILQSIKKFVMYLLVVCKIITFFPIVISVLCCKKHTISYGRLGLKGAHYQMACLPARYAELQHTCRYVMSSKQNQSVEVYREYEKSKCQSIGDDACFISDAGFGVFDGVGSWSKIGINCGKYTLSLAESCNSILNSYRNALASNAFGVNVHNTEMDLLSVLELAEENTRIENLAGSSTACIISLDKINSAISLLNLGDSGAMIFRPKPYPVPRDGSLAQSDLLYHTSSAYHCFDTPFQIGSNIDVKYASNRENIDIGGSSLAPRRGYATTTTSIPFDAPSDGTLIDIPIRRGDAILVATDGLFDNVHLEDIHRIIDDTLFAPLVFQTLIEDPSLFGMEQEGERLSFAVEQSLSLLVESARSNSLSNSITPWSVSVVKELLRIRRYLDTSILGLFRNDWQEFEKVVRRSPPSLHASSMKEVSVSIDARNHAIREYLEKNCHLGDRKGITPEALEKYQYCPVTNSFTIDSNAGKMKKPSRVSIFGGKPDDITILLAVIH